VFIVMWCNIVATYSESRPGMRGGHQMSLDVHTGQLTLLVLVFSSTVLQLFCYLYVFDHTHKILFSVEYCNYLMHL